MAKPKYRLRKEFRGVIIALPQAVINGDFFHSYKDANERIESDPQIAKYFETIKGDNIATRAVEPIIESDQESETSSSGSDVSSNYKAPEAISLIEEMEESEIEAFIEGEDRVTVLQAAGQKLG